MDWWTPPTRVATVTPASGAAHHAAKWSPDGSAWVTTGDDHAVRIYAATAQAEWLQGAGAAAASPAAPWSLVRHEGEPVYDVAWYPRMDAAAWPETSCCLLLSVRDHPVHLVDAWTGATRATYPARTETDEVVAPHALAFTTDGARFVAGFRGAVRLFDVQRPGDAVAVYATTPSRASRVGQKGLLASLAVSPDDGSLFAAGSFAGTVGLYTTDGATLLHLAAAHPHGVTHVAFSPDGRWLWSGGRRDADVVCWDIRHTAKALVRVPRLCTGNQRIAFGFDPHGAHLVTGQQDGHVLVYDLRHLATTATTTTTTAAATACPLVTAFHAHNACVVAAALHPSLPLLLTAAGERTYALQSSSSSSDGEASPPRPPPDCSLHIWRIGERWQPQSSEADAPDAILTTTTATTTSTTAAVTATVAAITTAGTTATATATSAPIDVHDCTTPLL